MVVSLGVRQTPTLQADWRDRVIERLIVQCSFTSKGKSHELDIFCKKIDLSLLKQKYN